MEKVVVDKDLCIGCGMCVGANPDYFAFNDEGYAEALDIEVKSEDKSDILSVVDACPGQAIKVEEHKTSEENTCHCGKDCDCTNESSECKCGENCNCKEDDSNCQCGEDCECKK